MEQRNRVPGMADVVSLAEVRALEAERRRVRALQLGECFAQLAELDDPGLNLARDLLAELATDPSRMRAALVLIGSARGILGP